MSDENEAAKSAAAPEKFQGSSKEAILRHREAARRPGVAGATVEERLVNFRKIGEAKAVEARAYKAATKKEQEERNKKAREVEQERINKLKAAKVEKKKDATGKTSE